VRGHAWHYRQEVEEYADGSLTMRFWCVVTDEIVRWLLSFGGRAVIDGPGGLRDAVRDEACTR